MINKQTDKKMENSITQEKAIEVLVTEDHLEMLICIAFNNGINYEKRYKKDIDLVGFRKATVSEFKKSLAYNSNKLNSK
tara:strand:+ start:3414 stop:3650 length:237 start_codon:yes stop_codon:yes gene_type:complete